MSPTAQNTRASIRLQIMANSITTSPAKRRRVNPSPLPQLISIPDDPMETPDSDTAERRSVTPDEDTMDFLNEVFRSDIIPGKSIYNTIKRPKEFTCPFSASTRQNPCTSFADPRKRKIQISNHLRIVRDKPDECHPLNDSLWDDPLVKDYYLVKRPTYTEEQRQYASRLSNKNYYERRKIREQKWLPKLQEKFMEGKLEKNHLRRVLVGKNRLEFDIQVTVADKVRERLELRIQNLRQEPEPPTELIQDLEAKHKELEKSRQIQDRLKQQAITISREVSGLFGNSKDDNLLASNADLLAYAGLSYPSSASPEAFYFFAAYYTPKLDWTTATPWKEEFIRDLKVSLTRQCKAWSQTFKGDDPEAMTARTMIEDRLQVFNASCDLVSTAREESEMYNEVEADAWEQDQVKLWESAKDVIEKAVFGPFNGVIKSPAALVTAVQSICTLVRGADKADERSRLALNAAQQALTANPG